MSEASKSHNSQTAKSGKRNELDNEVKAEEAQADTAKTSAKKAASEKKEASAEATEKKAKPAKTPKAEKKAKGESVQRKGKVIDDVRLYDVIERPVVTEKSTAASEQGKVVFRIRPGYGKQDVKKAVEALFGVQVVKVNTIKLPGKAKKFRGRPGQRSDVRKAIVTLAAGQSIDLAAGLK